MELMPILKKDDYLVVPNPANESDKSLCIQLTDGGPFDGIIVKYKKFQFADEENTDGSLNCTYEYDIVYAPPRIGRIVETDITELEGEVFEKKLGDIIIEILQDQIERKDAKDRGSDSEESNL